jgi:ABC-type lipoprotein release transport system permease subunit
MTVGMFLVLLAAIVVGVNIIHTLVSKIKDKVEQTHQLLQDEVQRRNQR